MSVFYILHKNYISISVYIIPVCVCVYIHVLCIYLCVHTCVSVYTSCVYKYYKTNMCMYIQQQKFQQMSEQIIGRLDEMGKRVDDLEKNVNELIQQVETREESSAKK